MIFYVDGACSLNGQEDAVGGHAVVILDDNENYLGSYSKGLRGTTNNREELRAILYVLLNYGLDNPIVYSDSAYAVNTLTSWMFSWAGNGWVKSDNKTPENLDLIQTYYDFWQKGYRIQLKKVKGHSTNKWNQLADKLAVEAKEKVNG